MEVMIILGWTVSSSSSLSASASAKYYAEPVSVSLSLNVKRGCRVLPALSGTMMAWLPYWQWSCKQTCWCCSQMWTVSTQDRLLQRNHCKPLQSVTNLGVECIACAGQAFVHPNAGLWCLALCNARVIVYTRCFFCQEVLLHFHDGCLSPDNVVMVEVNM